MGGTEALGEILKLDPKAKVIVSSGYSSNTSNDDFFELGFKEIVQKPFTMLTLLSVVENVMAMS